MGGKSGAKAADREAQEARAAEEARQARIRSGTERINSIFGQEFGDEFYSGRRDAYTEYAAPQLEDQYAKAQKDLTFALARSGTLDSSIRSDKMGELQKLYDTNKQKVSDDALSYENQARSSVEDGRAVLLSSLNASGDDTGAVNSALARSKALTAPAAFSPLASLFSDFTAGLGTQAAMERAEAASGGAVKAKYNTGLFGAPTSSVVVR